MVSSSTPPSASVLSTSPTARQAREESLRLRCWARNNHEKRETRTVGAANCTFSLALLSLGRRCIMPPWLTVVAIVSLIVSGLCAAHHRRGHPGWPPPAHGNHESCLARDRPLCRAAGAVRLFQGGPALHASGHAPGGEARRGAAGQEKTILANGRRWRDALRRRLHARRHLRRMAVVRRRATGAVWREDFRRLGDRLSIRLCVRHRLPVLHHQADARSFRRARTDRGDQGRHAVADRLADRHVRLDGDRRRF